jgi:VIT1/CCC1 family predicted Fe2+/Mn2+ transporter
VDGADVGILSGVAQTAAPSDTGGDHHASSARSHHRDLQGGVARAAVFGVSDGLLTNISLILGVAGASPPPAVVLLAGLAGLVAGAFSMAAGEFVSMSAQSELLQRELEVERRELERHPEAETRELAAVYRRRGVEEADARRIAEAIMKDPVIALEVHAREEMGLRPGKTGNPWQAAGSSFVTFSIGAVIPLLPWFFVSGTLAALLSIVLGAVAVLAVGWTVAIFTGRSRVRSALRQLAFATVAAAVAFGVGHLVGNLVNLRAG